MNPKVATLLRQYDEQLCAAGVLVQKTEDMAERGSALGHLRWMIKTMLEDGGSWSTRKVNRWLGFCQGALWYAGATGILALRDDSRDLYDEAEGSNSLRSA